MKINTSEVANTSLDANRVDLPKVSIVVPVYNEVEVLTALFDRLYPAMDKLNISYEIIFINDGSKDHSLSLLNSQFNKRPEVTRVIVFNGNFGQHRAIMAGFLHTRGQRIITLDADLQNPPEEIVNLLAEMDKGYDYVGTIRRQRKDSMWRHFASRSMNKLRERISEIKITDQGCMLRAYSRSIVDLINLSQEAYTFIPALAYSYAQNPTEIVVDHEERFAGESKYSIYSLIRLNFDLMTGFSIVPLQIFSIIGIAVSALSALLFFVLAFRRIFIGPEEGGLFTLFALAFFLIGVALFGIGILGEYIGRIYQQVRQRPHYQILKILEQTKESNNG
jgi:undecaprenyl-phosphate 4-deoxy-4-formamido-L-arabinose transferase